MTTLSERQTNGRFLAVDRCHRRGARAQLRAVLGTGEVLLCTYHARWGHAALVQVALRIERGDAAEPVV